MNACFTVYMEENLALNKPASQSGTYLTFVASRAVDGVAGSESCSGEEAEYDWWSVDLELTYDVSSVTITNYNNQNSGLYTANIHN